MSGIITQRLRNCEHNLIIINVKVWLSQNFYSSTVAYFVYKRLWNKQREFTFFNVYLYAIFLIAKTSPINKSLTLTYSFNYRTLIRWFTKCTNKGKAISYVQLRYQYRKVLLSSDLRPGIRQFEKMEIIYVVLGAFKMVNRYPTVLFLDMIISLII